MVTTRFLKDVFYLSGIVPVILILNEWSIINTIAVTIIFQVVIAILIKRTKGKLVGVSPSSNTKDTATVTPDIQLLWGAVIFGVIACVKYKYPVLVFAAPAVGILVSLFTSSSEQLLKRIGVM
jgi:hypothetical protein